ncbi:MAG: arginine--tRNA ligase [Chloroflexi bacterium RBG_13_60_9]|nr:MAG: arginine--tRNA ligase [Chloroflexi bacterium RBG_13_60_9]
MRIYSAEVDSIGSQILDAFTRRGITDPVAVEWSPIPFSGQWGLGTSGCIKAAAFLARNKKTTLPVPQQAQQLAEQIASEIALPAGFARIDAVRGYLNISFETKPYVEKVLEAVLSLGKEYGRGIPKNETVMVEHANPNTHHSFHIGHFRNVVLGEALARLTEFAGYKTIRAAYPGDIGLGVVKCMWGYQKFHAGEEPAGAMERGRWLGQVYTEASTLLEPRPDETETQRAAREGYEAEVRDLYRLWDTGDKQTRELWERTRQWSLDELDAVLKELDTPIDVFFFESQADELGKSIVDELIARGIAEDERPTGGPVIVRIDDKLGLKKETYRVAVILRSDGTSLYLTKDLALAKIKFEQYHVDRSVYVVDVRQSLHFQQAFKILELWGFPQASKCFHLAYEIVTLPEGTMSSRKGNIVYYLDVAEEARRRISAIIAEKNPNLSGAKRETTARQIGIGGMKYAMLAVDNTKQIIFSWDTALSFDGQAAPYIQYAHVRASSILEKTGGVPRAALPAYEMHPSEITLIDWISRFPGEVERAAEEYKRLYMANYAFFLAKAFSDFYRECQVLNAEAGIRDVRLAIVAATRQTLANSLRLLGIEAPQAM